MRKSIQTKLMSLIITGMVILALSIGGISIYNMSKMADDESKKVMNLTADESAGALNDVLGRIEQSVEIMSVYTVKNLESVERLITDVTYHDAYLEQLEELAENVIEETEGAVAIYVRLVDNLSFPTDGFFLVRNTEYSNNLI